MSRLEVLVTTMHQENLEKYASMNLHTDAVIANQADRDETVEEITDGHSVKMITTSTRGTSVNRNIAMDHSSGEYILFSDDDLIFHDDYEKTILEEFEQHPEAEAIRFNVRQIAGRETINTAVICWGKATRRKITSWGVCGVAIKRSVLIDNALRFDENFGPGTDNSCGEDTIFLQDMLKRNVALYLSPKEIADIDQSYSTWFEGYNENYFVTAGKVIAKIYPVLSYGLVIRSTLKCVRNKKTELSFMTILKCYYKGVVQQTFKRGK